jgi:TIR domain-containing protein
MDEVRIFISYAREDETRVKQLYQWLADSGFQPWLDREHIISGMRWEPVIKKALRLAHHRPHVGWQQQFRIACCSSYADFSTLCSSTFLPLTIFHILLHVAKRKAYEIFRPTQVAIQSAPASSTVRLIDAQIRPRNVCAGS